MEKLNFFKCELCGNIAILVENTGNPIVCCGQKMQKQEINRNEIGKEKHAPVVTKTMKSIEIKVGEILHPSTQEHHVVFIGCIIDNGIQVKKLKYTENPIANFYVNENFSGSAFAFCNLHGLWISEF